MENKITGYVYSVETKQILAEITGIQAAIEKYVNQNYDDSCGLTYSPAFGCNDGLIDNNNVEYIEISYNNHIH
jgi:hypothetical protein